MKSPRRKAECLVCSVLILTSVFLTISLLLEARAVPAVTSITPTSGNVGTAVNLIGNITTLNGTFQIRWDNLSITTASAVGNLVNVSFPVPPSTAGSHVVTLADVANGTSAAVNFTVLTAYSLSLPELASPAQRQEGDHVPVYLNMTGGVQGQTSVANITVRAPNGASYVRLDNITTENDGNGTLILNYPDDFSVGANTNFTGQYNVSFNSTLGNTTFFLGLTNQSEYHRNQALNITATYTPGENVTLALTSTNLNYSENLTADNATGMVHYVNSTILSNASIGVYTVNLTSVSGPTKKSPPDVQNFTVPGFSVNITARNLAYEPVQYVLVSVFENQNSIANLTSDVDGLASPPPMLEAGNYLCNASYGGQDVGRTPNFTIEVNETSTAFDLYCNLTNLMVKVVDEDNVLIPGVEFNLMEEDQNYSVNIAPTDVNGTSIVHSLLPLVNNTPANYTLNASRYGTLFSTSFNATAPLQLPVAAWFNVTIVCPKMDLQVNVTDGSLHPIGDANVEATEEEGGLFYSNITSPDGTLTLRCTLGRYLVRVYAGGMKLNETTVDLNETTVNATIICEIYGLNVSVRVSDYFGQSIPNLNVTLQWAGYPNSTSRVSGNDGRAVFEGITGGDLQLTVHFTSQSDPLAFTTVYVDNSTTIEMRLSKYLILAGMIIEMDQFVTVMIIVVIAIFILGLEVYRRKRLRPQQSGS
jgi:hypothetical protein